MFSSQTGVTANSFAAIRRRQVVSRLHSLEGNKSSAGEIGGKVVDAGLYTNLQHGRVVLEFMVEATGCRASPSRPHPRAEAVQRGDFLVLR